MTTTTTATTRRGLAKFGKATLSFEQATEAAAYTVSKEEIFDADGAALPREFRGMFHSETRKTLGVVGDGFTFYQPSESLEIMRAAVETVSGARWQSVAVGGGGATLYAFAALKTEIVAPKRGDKVGLSLFMRDGFDGTTRQSWGVAAETLACTNGALRSENLFAFSGKHTRTLRDRIEAVRLEMGMRIQDEVEKLRGFVHRLDSQEMSRAEVDAFSLALFGVANERALVDEATSQVRTKVDAVRTLFVRGTGNVGKTRWDAWNAVTEFADWQSSFRSTSAASAEENRFESMIGGTVLRLKDRAAELLLS
jgi:hypothetical protein